MANLMAVNDEKAAELDARFSKSMFRSTQEFIQFYNSGMVNKSDDNVNRFAQEVDQTFKNVRLQGKALVFISEHEVYLSEIMDELKLWEILVPAKARLRELVASEEVATDAKLEFSEDKGTLVLVVADENGGATKTRLSDERFFKPADVGAVERFTAQSSEPGRLSFVASELLEADDNFIGELHRLTIKN